MNVKGQWRHPKEKVIWMLLMSRFPSSLCKRSCYFYSIQMMCHDVLCALCVQRRAIEIILVYFFNLQ